ncbi:MAG: zinc ribbon domain-containing protein [Sulfolobales archaeon]|nr:zinc ribbon domain-containing protein [Sulfolobales archaeon]
MNRHRYRQGKAKIRRIVLSILLVLVLLPNVSMDIPSVLLTSGDTQPKVGDQWLFELHSNERIYDPRGPDNFVLAGYTMNTIQAAGSGYYTLNQTTFDTDGNVIDTVLYTLYPDWGVKEERWFTGYGETIVYTYKQPLPFAFIVHPRSLQDSGSITAVADKYQESSGGRTYLGNITYNLRYYVNGTIQVDFKGIKVPAYIVVESIDYKEYDVEQGYSNGSLKLIYIINNDFKLPFIYQFVENIEGVDIVSSKEELKDYKLDPDPIAKYRGTTTYTTTTTTAGTTTTTTYTSPGSTQPKIGDQWFYNQYSNERANNPQSPDNFTLTGYHIYTIQSATEGYYILNQTFTEIYGKIAAIVMVTLYPNWSIKEMDFLTLLLFKFVFKQPLPFVVHPRSPQDSGSFTATADIYLYGGYAGNVTLTLSYRVNGTTWVTIKGVKVPAYIVVQKVESQTYMVVGGQESYSNDSYTEVYLINNDFKLPFLRQTIKMVEGVEVVTDKSELVRYTLDPDPIAKYGGTTTTTTTTSPVTTTTTTATPTPTTTTMGPAPKSYYMSFILRKEGNYSAASVQVPIEITDLSSGEVVSVFNLTGSRILRLQESSYAITVSAMKGITSDGKGYYRFIKWIVSAREYTDPILELDLRQNITITMVIEVYTLQAQAEATQTTTPTTTQTPRNTTTTRTEAMTPPRTTAQPIPGGGDIGRGGGGDIGAIPPTQAQAWYSNPLIIGSIAGGSGAAAVIALFILRKRHMNRRGGYARPAPPPPIQQPQVSQAPSQPSTQLGIICPVCGYQNPPSAKFCRSCGSQLQQPQQTAQAGGQRICPHCGKPISSATARFCPKCGSRLS